MEHGIQELITEYINKNVLFENDTPEFRNKIAVDIMQMPSITEVQISDATPIESIKVIDTEGNVGTWTITRTEGNV
jgi:hypothetical protein